jgi:hypothetical protein
MRRALHLGVQKALGVVLSGTALEVPLNNGEILT